MTTIARRRDQKSNSVNDDDYNPNMLPAALRQYQMGNRQQSWVLWSRLPDAFIALEEEHPLQPCFSRRSNLFGAATMYNLRIANEHDEHARPRRSNKLTAV